MITFLLGLLAVLLYGCFQSVSFLLHGTSPAAVAQEIRQSVTRSQRFKMFMAEKQLNLKRYGAPYFLSEGITVSRFYLYKALSASGILIPGGLASVRSGGSMLLWFLTLGLGILAWFFPDLYLISRNRDSNTRMMRDVMEMSRSVLYAKRGGQYIGDALKDAMMLVENRRLKTAMIRLCSHLETQMAVETALTLLESDFSNPEITSFCTVIRSLQLTGQVDEALRSLEHSIEREQISVNRRRCIVLENTTILYVMLVAVDILVLILYCIIQKLMVMEMNF